MKGWLSLAAIVVLLVQTGSAQKIDVNRIRKDVAVLAADSLGGRGTASLGEIKAANYIARSFEKTGLKPKGTNGTFFQPFNLSMKLDGFDHQATARNVVGYLDNGATQTIVIGAHYDHLGEGFQSGSLGANSQGLIHNGADDNASGTAGVLELARYFAGNNVKERFNFLFVTFSGEELGLLGSKFFADKPAVGIDSIAFMINMDMIGRYSGEKGLSIGGWGTSSWWGKLIPDLAKQSGLKYSVDSSGIGPSDHTSFYMKNKPVLFFFTGAHGDYHKPSDDADKVNYQGEVSVLTLISQIIDKVEKQQGVPDFVQVGNPHSQNTRSSFKVTLGVMPDYSYTGKGLKIDGVNQGRPGVKAGLKAGDIVLKLGSFSIKDIYEYMDALGKFEKGQTTDIEYQRSGETIKSKITF